MKEENKSFYFDFSEGEEENCMIREEEAHITTKDLFEGCLDDTMTPEDAMEMIFGDLMAIDDILANIFNNDMLALHDALKRTEN